MSNILQKDEYFQLEMLHNAYNNKKPTAPTYNVQSDYDAGIFLNSILYMSWKCLGYQVPSFHIVNASYAIILIKTARATTTINK